MNRKKIYRCLSPNVKVLLEFGCRKRVEWQVIYILFSPYFLYSHSLSPSPPLLSPPLPCPRSLSLLLPPSPQPPSLSDSILFVKWEKKWWAYFEHIERGVIRSDAMEVVSGAGAGMRFEVWWTKPSFPQEVPPRRGASWPQDSFSASAQPVSLFGDIASYLQIGSF